MAHSQRRLAEGLSHNLIFKKGPEIEARMGWRDRVGGGEKLPFPNEVDE